MKTLTIKQFQIINLIIFSVIVCYFNFIAEFNFGDDVPSKSRPLNLDSIINAYLTWTGRIVPTILQFFLSQHPLVFRIANSMIMIGMPVATWILVDKNKKLSNLTLIVLLFMLYDYVEMRTAGLITTYSTYYWNLFANVLFYISIRHYLKSSNILSLDLVLAVFVGLIACQMEVASLINTMIFGALFVADYYKNRVLNKKILLLMLVPLLSLVFFLTCPGTHNRGVAETITWLPEFSSYTMPYKLYLGLSETLLYYFNSKSILLMLFLGALLVNVVKKELSLSYLFIVLFCLAGYFIVRNSDLILKFSNITKTKPYVFLVFLLCFCVFVMLIICKLFETKLDVLLLLNGILLLGFLTRVIMGFSPTLYASSTRTYMYCDFSILVVTYYLLKQSETNLDELCPIFLTFFAYPYFIDKLLQ